MGILVSISGPTASHYSTRNAARLEYDEELN